MSNFKKRVFNLRVGCTRFSGFNFNVPTFTVKSTGIPRRCRMIAQTRWISKIYIFFKVYFKYFFNNNLIAENLSIQNWQSTIRSE